MADRANRPKGRKRQGSAEGARVARTTLISPYLSTFKGLRVENTFAVVASGPAFGFKVRVEDEIFRVRTICGDRLLYVEGAQDGTAAADHPAGAEVVRL